MGASFFDRFLAGDPAVRGLLPSAVGAGGAPARPELIAALAAQEEGWGASAARRRNVAALGEVGARAVVTGQQVGLFLGPLYTIYKAASAVVRARAVGAVPVFWLQTEDHDWEEVRSCRVLLPGGEMRLELAGDERRISVGHRVLSEEVRGVIERLDRGCEGMAGRGETIGLLKENYVPGRGLGAAFAGVIAALFGEEGLVVIDPRTEAVARLAAPVYRRAIVEAEAIGEELAARGRELAEVGIEEQVRPRAGASLLFFHPEGVEGARYRLERRGGEWGVAGAEGRFAESELLELVEREPMRFSTSALLRPIVQDAILPTVMYVGGPAELAYFAQLAPLYRRFGREMPAIVPRARVRCVDGAARRYLEALGISAGEVGGDRAALLGRAAGVEGAEEVRGRLMEGIGRELDRLEGVVPGIDGALADGIRRTRATVERAVGRFAARYGRAVAERDRVAVERIDRLRGLLFPGGVAQERVYSLPTFSCRMGARAFVEKILATIDAGEMGVQEVLL